MKPITSSVTSVGRDPTADERLGMAWWNGLTEVARIFWLEQASVGGRIWDISAADAWAAYKTIHGPKEGNPTCSTTSTAT